MTEPVPTIDFDLDSPLAGLHTLGLLLWSKRTTSAERFHAAKEWMWRCYESRMIELAESTILATGVRAWAGGKLELIFKELGLRIDADEFMQPFGLLANDNLELVFHLLLCARAKNHHLVHELGSSQTRRHPTEGKKADFLDYIIANELGTLLPRYAVLAGLALLVVASMKVNRPNQAPTLTKARSIIGKAVVLHGTKSSLRRQVEYWPDWAPVAPLWAGILAEAACWHRDNLIDEARLEHQILNVLSTGKRRWLAYQYAKWFTSYEFARNHRAKRAVGRMWDPKFLIHIPERVLPLRPALPQFVFSD